MTKRIFDIVSSSIIILLLLPLILLIGFLIFIKLGSPVIFKQQRIGYKNKKFIMYKFRSMKEPSLNLKSDEQRLTPFGKKIRALSIDELPELINVIKGDMSLVGPRPLLVEYLELYTPEQKRRHEVRPGITGWAQINGRNAISWEKKFEFDVWYVDNSNFFLDLKILLLTIKKVFFKENITAEKNSTMPKFTGTSNNE